MENSQLVSVIITTYNRNHDMLIRAIDSVQSQTYNHLEIVIVDDNGRGSPYSLEIATCMNSISERRINLIQHETNLGACAARNTGIINSHGDFIAFLDDDDEWLPLKIEMQVDAFRQNQKLGLVYCKNYTRFGLKEPIEVSRKIYNGNCYKELLYANFIGSTSFVMTKRSVLSEVGLFNIGMKSAQDYELWLRIAKKYEVFCVPSPQVIYNDHDGERITSSLQKKIEGLEMLNSIIWEDIKKTPRLLSRRLIVLSPFYQKRDGYWKGLMYSIKAFLIYPFSISSCKMVINSILNRN